MAVDTHVGTRIRMRRLMAGLSQEGLGDKLGVSFQQVQKYEKGTNRVGSSRLHQIAEALGVPVSFFFVGIEAGVAANGTDPVPQFVATAEGLRLVRAFSLLPQAQRRVVCALVESMVEVDSGSAS